MVWNLRQSNINYCSCLYVSFDFNIGILNCFFKPSIIKYVWFDEIKLSTELKQCDGIWTEGWNDEKYDRHSHTLQYMYGYLTCHIQGETYTELNVYRLVSRRLSKQLVVNILYIWLNLLRKVAIHYSLR